MRSLFSKDIIQNPYKVSPFHQRSRLKSIKQLRQLPFKDLKYQSKTSQQHLLQILQKKLVQDSSKQQNQQTTTINLAKQSSKIFSKHSIKQQSQLKLQTLRNSNKLFQYFEELYKKQVPAEKVEREKVNFCQKQFQQMKNKVKSKLQGNKSKLNELQEILKLKYLELHQYHEQAKQLSLLVKKQAKQKKQNLQKKNKLKLQRQSSQVQAKPNSTEINLRSPSLKQKLYVLQQTITYFKKQITKIEEQIESINTKQNSIAEEWIIFLKLFLNSGFYMSNGCQNILIELKNMKATLTIEDLLTDIIDQNSKRYLVWHYQHFQHSSINVHKNGSIIYDGINSEKNKFYQRSRINSNIQMNSIIKDANLKNIYSNTRQAMINLLKNGSFKTSPETKFQKQLILPKIQRKHTMTHNSRVSTIQDSQMNEMKKGKGIDILTEKKRQQINRINHIYFGNGQDMQIKGRLIKRIFFGFSVK